MSDYAAALRSATNTWAAAYVQFETGRLREGFRAYAFVEDDDDKPFYQKALTQIDGICYLGCGGKTGVIALFERLIEENKADGNLFFVDRDTESLPFIHAEEILRTKYYSWESHVCVTDYVGWYLERKLDPSPSPADLATIKDNWNRSVAAFKPVFDKLTALTRTALVLDKSLGMSEVVFVADANKTSLTISPGGNALSWYEEKVNIAIQHGASRAQIVACELHYAGASTVATARGKALFTLLRVFVASVMKHLGRCCHDQYNSAKAWVEAMPWTDSALDYVRAYADARLKPL